MSLLKKQNFNHSVFYILKLIWKLKVYSAYLVDLIWFDIDCVRHRSCSFESYSDDYGQNN